MQTLNCLFIEKLHNFAYFPPKLIETIEERKLFFRDTGSYKVQLAYLRVEPG